MARHENLRVGTLEVGTEAHIQKIYIGGTPGLRDGTEMTGSEITVLDGVTGGTVTASKALVVDASKDIGTLGIVDVGTITGAALILESLAPMTIKLNDTDALQLDNAAIASFAAATDTAGQDVYMETEDAGATPTTAKTGGLLSIKTGDGSAGAAAVVAGAGGAMALSTGAGGAASGTAAGGAGGAASLTAGVGGAHSGGGASGAGGAGGASSLIAGAGGATSNVGTDNGGAGGSVAITAGVGGAASAGTGDGGNGGDITLTVGAGGATTGGVAGDAGKVQIAGGLLHLATAQVIDMGDAEVVLTLNPGTPVGTLLTSNVLAVDANSGATEDLLLPPEADAAGVVLWIRNTGGESIVVKEDGDSTTIATIATAESGYFFCDGTAWQGLNFA